MHPTQERTLVILKPDAVQRSLLGEIIHRFERKGLKIIGMKMVKLSQVVLEEHYIHHKDKPFFESLKKQMSAAPVVLIALEGIKAIEAVRMLAGPTKGYEAPSGTIRGDFSISKQANVVHASDSPENAALEIKRFFHDEELIEYKRSDFEFVYGDEERE